MDDIVKLKYKEEDLKLLAGLRLLDDDFMTVVFDRNTEAAGLVLNIIFGRDDIEVIEVVAQREYKNPVTGGRSIKLDIYAKDSDGKVYDIEVQRADSGADAHRARFHSSMLDTKMLKEKQKFNEIHDSYVIFITENDYMGLGKPLYHIERTVQETGGLFGDGSHIIYVNGSYKNDSEAVGKHVKHFKETEGGMERMCKAMEERVDRERIENSFEHIKNLMEAMKMTAEQAMEVLKIPDDDKVILAKKF